MNSLEYGNLLSCFDISNFGPILWTVEKKNIFSLKFKCARVYFHKKQASNSVCFDARYNLTGITSSSFLRQNKLPYMQMKMLC